MVQFVERFILKRVCPRKENRLDGTHEHGLKTEGIPMNMTSQNNVASSVFTFAIRNCYKNGLKGGAFFVSLAQVGVIYVLLHRDKIPKISQIMMICNYHRY